MKSPNKQNLFETTYLQKGRIGSKRLDNSMVSFALIALPKDKTVSGIVEIRKTQNFVKIKLNVAGTIHAVNEGNITTVVKLYGEYKDANKPEIKDNPFKKFTAYLEVDALWNGIGSFNYGSINVNNVMVSPTG